MAMTFDATLKDMGRDSPQGFLVAFDRPPTGPVKLLNVDLSTVTTAADLILGLGDPPSGDHPPRLPVQRRRLEARRRDGVQCPVVRALPRAGAHGRFAAAPGSRAREHER